MDGPKVVKGNYEMIVDYEVKNCNFGGKGIVSLAGLRLLLDLKFC